MLFARVSDPDGTKAQRRAVLTAAAAAQANRNSNLNREPKPNPQIRIDKVRSIFQSRPDYVRPEDSPVELHVWFAFALVCFALLAVVHFFVGWFKLAGVGIVCFTGLLASIELQQSPVKIPETWLPTSSESLDQLDRAIRIPPSSVHIGSALFQLVVLFRLPWFSHWLKLVVQLLIAAAGIGLLHRLRNPASHNILAGYFYSNKNSNSKKIALHGRNISTRSTLEGDIVVDAGQSSKQKKFPKKQKKKKKKKEKDKYLTDEERQLKKEKKKKKKSKKKSEETSEAAPSLLVSEAHQDSHTAAGKT